ncbi:MAG: hypothetical protein KatS3mg131_3677 [Candidatus Tectimicrobiota bacterium]|nr:MAG: hypothetical protein KatS3mg131_3677 [Candidatus Tectomicrobia bacterium]
MRRRNGRDGFPPGWDDHRGRLAAASPWLKRRARLPKPLLDKAPDELAQRSAAQRGAGLECPVQLVGKVDGGAHIYILMRIRLAVKVGARRTTPAAPVLPPALSPASPAPARCRPGRPASGLSSRRGRTGGRPGRGPALPGNPAVQQVGRGLVASLLVVVDPQQVVRGLPDGEPTVPGWVPVPRKLLGSPEKGVRCSGRYGRRSPPPGSAPCPSPLGTPAPGCAGR